MRTARQLLAAAIGTTVLLGAAPSQAVSVPLRCGSASTTTPWQVSPIPAFPGVQNVPTADVVTADVVDAADPARILVTNGTTVAASVTAGCSWTRPLTLSATPAGPDLPSGLTARIRAVALLPSGRGLLAVHDGATAAGRLVVLGSDEPAAGGYVRSDSGLPPVGDPTAMAGGPGDSVYLAVRTLPPGGPAGALPAVPAPLPLTPGSGLGGLYASTDGGRSWSARQSTADLGSAVRDISAIAVAADRPGSVFVVSAGRLLASLDGGRSFRPVPLPSVGDVLAVATGVGGEVVVSGSGGTATSFDGGASWPARIPVVAQALALRGGDYRVALVSSGTLELVDPLSGRSTAVRSVSAPGSVSGDRSTAPTFHAVAGHELLRYVDPAPAGGLPLGTAPAVGDVPPPPPLPGTLSPAQVHLRLPLGGTRTVRYALNLPNDPTPLNVFFLVDVSSTLTQYQSTLTSSIEASTAALARRRVSVRTGVATLGTGPSKGKPPYPDVSTVPGYRKPTLYHLLRRLGPVDDQFYAALGQVQTETLPVPNLSGDANNDAEEGQLLALEQSVNPRGVLDPNVPAGPVPVYSVPGGQEAGFVRDPYQRNVIVTATDEYFANPAGSPDRPDGSLDFDRVIRELRSAGVAAVGLTIGTTSTDDGSSFPDLARIARGTGAVAPPGGMRCSADERVPAGSPIVCTNPANFGSLLTSVLSGLRDVQDLTAEVTGARSVVTSIAAPALLHVDVTKARTLPLSVTYSCAGLSPGTYATALKVRLRGYAVGTSGATVDCGSPAPALSVPAAAARLAAGGTALGTLPSVNVVTGLAPAPPAGQAQGQAQSQTQTQSQVQPGTAAALQQQRELQLALALQGEEGQADAAPADTQLAMVGRRRDEQAAVGVLAIAMMACAGLGLSRLCGSPQPVRQRTDR